MQALRHLDKQFIVLPVFMLAINFMCYSIAVHGGDDNLKSLGNRILRYPTSCIHTVVPLPAFQGEGVVGTLLDGKHLTHADKGSVGVVLALHLVEN